VIFALAARAAEGLAEICCIGLPCLLAAQVGRVSRNLAASLTRRVHAVGGPWFASYCRRHGALLLKLGQVVASRPDLLPLAWVDACAALRDQAPARTWRQVEAVLARAYEGRIADHLHDIDQTPLASASFGQVHRARLPDGTQVAVKVQHGDLGPKVAVDLALLRLALGLIRFAAPGWPVGLIADEVARTSRQEQDYLHEATAAERLRPLLLRHRIAVPRVYLEHTRDTVLVTEFAAGETLARTAVATLPRVQREDLAQRLIAAWLDMLLDDGLLHADPHGGNLIIDGERLWLIDFGMTTEIGPRERLQYARFLTRLAREDIDGMVDELVGLGVLLPGTELDDVRALAREIYGQLGNLNPRTFKGSRREAELSAKVAAFMRRGSGIAFPRHTILLSRALGLIEGVCGELMPDKPLLELAKPRLQGLLSPTGLAKDWLTDLGQRLQRFIDLPERVERALDRQRGVDLTPLVTGVVLIAAVMLPDSPWRVVATVVAGIALLFALLRR
jgi:ubiquinone biosynthesis protein